MAQPVTFLGGMLMTFSASHCPFCNPKKQVTYNPSYHASRVLKIDATKAAGTLTGALKNRNTVELKAHPT